jgi:cyanophycinase
MSYPKGTLVAVGGAEQRDPKEGEEKKNGLDFMHEGILKTIVDLACKKGGGVIEVVTTASSEPEDLARTYKKAFRQLGCKEVGHLDITTREEAEDPNVLDRLQKCNCVMFSGGDQARLCSILGGTTFMQMLMEKYRNEYFIIAGTSAGAAAMSGSIITGGDAAEAYLKGTMKLGIGFGLLPKVIIDTHFDERGRLGRLVQAIAEQPGIIAIGLSEDTGIIVEKGNRLRAIGSSSVVILDGSSIEDNNLSEIDDCAPLSLSNLKLHVLSHKDIYELEARKFTAVKSYLHER